MPYPQDSRQAGNYTGGVTNVNEYHVNPGVCILPLAEDPPTNGTELRTWSPIVALRLHAPFRTRRFTQVTGKDRNPAPIAAPQNTGAFVFVGGSITIKPELSTAYTDYNWFVGCDYTYVEACTSQDQFGNQLGLVLGVTPIQTTIDEEIIRENGYAAPLIGAAAFGGKAVTSASILGGKIVNKEGQLNHSWSYPAQAFYPPQLFYTDLANGGPPVVLGG